MYFFCYSQSNEAVARRPSLALYMCASGAEGGWKKCAQFISASRVLRTHTNEIVHLHTFQ